MPGVTREPLTPAEWKIMKIVWKLKRCAARDVCEIASREQGWAATTTKTLLRRLLDKQCLTTTAVGNSFLYEPTRGVSRTLLGAAEALMENFLEGTTGLVLSHMVKNSKLTQAEIDDLRKLLDQQSSTPRRS